MKIQSLFISMFMLIVAMTVTACNTGKMDNNTSNFLLFLLGNDGGDTVISIAAIPGVTPPNYGETPVTTITETAQYTGTVSWSPYDDPFDAMTEYTATITLTAKSGYTLTGVTTDFFAVAGATSVTNSADSGVVTAVFPETGAAPATVINIAAIPGVTAPVRGATPVTTITETAQYTGTVSWSPNDNPFAATTAYTATITLTTKPGYTLTGVTADFFTVAGTTSVTNDADSGIITAEFPATEAAPPAVINISAILGVAAPAYGATPVTAITETAQYTGTVSWSPNDNPFAATTEYTATITMTAKSGYTFTGVATNFFTVAGSTSDTNPANSCVVTAVFPATGVTLYTGDMETYTVDSVSFNMAYMPGGKTFPTGQLDTGTATISNAFWIGETELTYELWQIVYDWATAGSGSTGAGQYNFVKVGRRGGYWDSGIHYYASGHETHPVTYINWREAMVLCNALTECYNANNGTAPDLDCVYYTDSGYVTPIRSANDITSIDETQGSQDNPYVKAAAKGFRLLTNNEWELAARWRGSDTTNVVTGTIGGVDFSAMAEKWTKGNSASGATTYYNDNTNGSGEPGKSANDVVAVYYQYWNGSAWVDTGVTSTAEVKSKGVSGANALGLYDMSGNVWEWCFDLRTVPGSRRVIRGGSWFDHVGLPIGYVNNLEPFYEYYYVGFRFARTQ